MPSHNLYSKELFSLDWHWGLILHVMHYPWDDWESFQHDKTECYTTHVLQFYGCYLTLVSYSVDVIWPTSWAVIIDHSIITRTVPNPAWILCVPIVKCVITQLLSYLNAGCNIYIHSMCWHWAATYVIHILFRNINPSSTASWKITQIYILGEYSLHWEEKWS